MTSDAARSEPAYGAAIVSRIADELFSDECEVWVQQYQSNLEAPEERFLLRLSTPEAIKTYFSDPPKHSKPQYISLIKPSSLEPFKIDEYSFWQLFGQTKLQPIFLDLFIGFRAKSSLFTERSQGLLSASVNSRRQCMTICYSLAHIENRVVAGRSSWADRQIGVYQHYQQKTPENSLVMILQTKCNSRAPGSHAAFAPQEPQNCGRPFKIHAVIMSEHVCNWRWYLDEHRARCVAWESETLVADISDQSDESLSFQRLQHIRNAESQLSTTATTLEATSLILAGILEVNDDSCQCTEALADSCDEDIVRLQALQSTIQGYLRATRLLQDRLKQLTQLLVDGMNHREQATAATINKTLLQMTEKAADDNFSLRTITLITLIYLPTQIVAAFFGTNFVIANEQRSGIRVVEDVWLFVVFATALTLFTVGTWLFVLLRRRLARARARSKRAPNEESWSAKESFR